MFKTYSSSSSLVMTSHWFATSRLVVPVYVRLVYCLAVITGAIPLLFFRGRVMSKPLKRSTQQLLVESPDILGSRVRCWYPSYERIHSKLVFTLLSVHKSMFSCLVRHVQHLLFIIRLVQQTVENLKQWNETSSRVTVIIEWPVVNYLLRVICNQQLMWVSQ